MNFPADEFSEIKNEPIFKKAIHRDILQVFKGKTDYLFILENEDAIRSVVPEMDVIKTFDSRGVIISAPGEKVDFVSRFFAPQSGIPEDPVTGSAHTTLTPYWSKRLNKTAMTAWQLSSRGGELRCKNINGRVEIEGKAKLYSSGYIHI
jgi:PhzF family phenazine biosynthesis protein